MAKKAKTREDRLRIRVKKISGKLDFLIVGIFFIIFAAAAVNEALEAKGMTLRSLLAEVRCHMGSKRKQTGGNAVE